MDDYKNQLGPFYKRAMFDAEDLTWDYFDYPITSKEDIVTSQFKLGQIHWTLLRDGDWVRQHLFNTFIHLRKLELPDEEDPNKVVMNYIEIHRDVVYNSTPREHNVGGLFRYCYDIVKEGIPTAAAETISSDATFAVLPNPLDIVPIDGMDLKFVDLLTRINFGRTCIWRCIIANKDEYPTGESGDDQKRIVEKLKNKIQISKFTDEMTITEKTAYSTLRCSTLYCIARLNSFLADFSTSL